MADDDEPIKRSGSTARHADRIAADTISTVSESQVPGWKPPAPEPWEVALDTAKAGREMSVRADGVANGTNAEAVEDSLLPQPVPPQPHEIVLDTARAMHDLSVTTAWEGADAREQAQQEAAIAPPITSDDIGFVSDAGLASVDESSFGDGALLPDPPSVTFEPTDPELTSFADEPIAATDDSSESWMGE